MAQPQSSPLTIYVGIDPATTTGLAILYGHGQNYSASIEHPLYASQHALVREGLLALPKGARLVVAIETPPAGLKGAAVPRWLGNQWEELLRSAYPRRVQVLRPTPTTWQRAMLGKIEKGTSKEASLAKAAVLVEREVSGHDEADALCLAHWARSVHWEAE